MDADEDRPEQTTQSVFELIFWEAAVWLIVAVAVLVLSMILLSNL